MKCQACDVILSDREATRKFIDSKEYIELCDHCFDYVREDLGFGPPDYALDTSVVDNDSERPSNN